MKKLWNNNRVLFFLLAILLVCFIAIVVVAMTFFYSRNTSVYGDRLNDINKHPVTSEVKDAFKEAVTKNTSVKDVTYNVRGRIIYITISFDEKITLEKAQKLISDSFETLTEDVLSYYDIMFTLKSDNFIIMGAKNMTNSNVTWNNNREVEKEEKE